MGIESTQGIEPFMRWKPNICHHSSASKQYHHQFARPGGSRAQASIEIRIPGYGHRRWRCCGLFLSSKHSSLVPPSLFSSSAARPHRLARGALWFEPMQPWRVTKRGLGPITSINCGGGIEELTLHLTPVVLSEPYQRNALLSLLRLCKELGGTIRGEHVRTCWEENCCSKTEYDYHQWDL